MVNYKIKTNELSSKWVSWVGQRAKCGVRRKRNSITLQSGSQRSAEKDKNRAVESQKKNTTEKLVRNPKCAFANAAA